MRTLGLDPIEVLVLPRVLALLLLLPVLGFLADIAGLSGGALMSWVELGISPAMFLTRLLDTDVSHFLVGLVKAPFFAVEKDGAVRRLKKAGFLVPGAPLAEAFRDAMRAALTDVPELAEALAAYDAMQAHLHRILLWIGTCGADVAEAARFDPDARSAA